MAEENKTIKKMDDCISIMERINAKLDKVIEEEEGC